MSLLIDTPRWEWRGQLWAHMISDTSLDELHAGARALNLRWLAFGRDHYDVPESMWADACAAAELVDSREIVRSLKRSGLRVPGGKPKKSWRRLDTLPAAYQSGDVADWLARVRPSFPDAAVEVLARPTEIVVLHLLRTPERPPLGQLESGPGVGHLVHTVLDNRYSLELVLPEQPGGLT